MYEITLVSTAFTTESNTPHLPSGSIWKFSRYWVCIIMPNGTIVSKPHCLLQVFGLYPNCMHKGIHWVEFIWFTKVKWFQTLRKIMGPCQMQYHQLCGIIWRGAERTVYAYLGLLFFPSMQGGRTFRIYDFISCDTIHVVYALECPCGLQYIGCTKWPLRQYISEQIYNI